MPHHDGESGDDRDSETDEVRRVQPYQATKTYLCPGCQQAIPPGLGHLVVVPHGAPKDRRHWHHACWEHRHDRRPGRQPTRR
ncbi:MAG: hypothetical protein ACRD0Q_10340 [Acidimicrobiales bacterium]